MENIHKVLSRTCKTLVFIPILFGAEVSLWFFGLTTLRADRAPARDNIHAPARQHPHLAARRPEADNRGGLLVFLFSQQFLDEEHDKIAFLVVAQADLADAEEGVHRRIDAHHFFHVVAPAS